MLCRPTFSVNLSILDNRISLKLSSRVQLVKVEGALNHTCTWDASPVPFRKKLARALLY